MFPVLALNVYNRAGRWAVEAEETKWEPFLCCAFFLFWLFGKWKIIRQVLLQPLISFWVFLCYIVYPPPSHSKGNIWYQAPTKQLNSFLYCNSHPEIHWPSFRDGPELLLSTFIAECVLVLDLDVPSALCNCFTIYVLIVSTSTLWNMPTLLRHLVATFQCCCLCGECSPVMKLLLQEVIFPSHVQPAGTWMPA